MMINVPPKPNAVRPFTSSIMRATLSRQCGSCSSISVEIDGVKRPARLILMHQADHIDARPWPPIQPTYSRAANRSRTEPFTL